MASKEFLDKTELKENEVEPSKGAYALNKVSL